MVITETIFGFSQDICFPTMRNVEIRFTNRLPHKKRNRVSIRDTAMIASGKRSLTTILGPVNNLYTKVKHGAQEGRLRSLL